MEKATVAQQPPRRRVSKPLQNQLIRLSTVKKELRYYDVFLICKIIVKLTQIDSSHFPKRKEQNR